MLSDLVTTALLHLLTHRLALTRINTPIADLDSDNRTRFRIAGQLHVVGWAKSTIAHRHYRSLRIGRADPDLLTPQRLLLGRNMAWRRLQLRQALQSLLNPLLALPGCPLPRRSLACRQLS